MRSATLSFLLSRFSLPRTDFYLVINFVDIQHSLPFLLAGLTQPLENSRSCLRSRDRLRRFRPEKYFECKFGGPFANCSTVLAKAFR